MVNDQLHMVNDQLQQALEQLEGQIKEVTQQEVKQSLEESLPQIDARAKGLVETLRQNQEGRMQLSIEGLKQDFLASLQDLGGQVDMLESQNEVVDQLQNQFEDIVVKVQKLENDFKNIGSSQHQARNLEHRLQAQFDEQSAMMAQKLRELEH